MSGSDSVSAAHDLDAAYRWRELGMDDLEGAVRLSAALGWPHRREDWQQLLQVGRGVALEHNDRLIGTGLCMPQGALATIGLIVIDEQWRGHGLGKRMMARTMALAGELPMLLVATVAGTPMYEKFGFVRRNSVAQYQGLAQAVGEPDPALAAMTAADRPSIERLADAGSGRAAVLDMALTTAESVKVCRRDERVVGFGMRRRFGRGEVIGPVVAETVEQAQALIDALLFEAEGQFVRLDTLGEAIDEAWLAERGLACADRIIQMSRGEVAPVAHPHTPVVQQFLLTTQALG
ncbi:GNAT family N-acetyltransferase [Salinisphaera sp. SPP-AMP-43]|uniref:GNAT family N-acetyltransferase n=1 Tax=Salinisphaera sp. SPP-AMP-43 TaxID=3121288 RepID=UPI003C6DE915